MNPAAPLQSRTCRPVPTGTPALTPAECTDLLPQVPGWSVVGNQLRREFQFPDYHRTMAFVNAVAWVAHSQDHHPDLEVSYSRCVVRFNTHTVGGLSENDFICAARINALES